MGIGLLFAFVLEYLADPLDFGKMFFIGFGVFHRERPEGFNKDVGDDEAGVAFIVSRNGIPRGQGVAGLLQALAVHLLKIVPLGPALQVRLADLPVFVGLLGAGEQALTLFLFGEVKKKLEYLGAIAVQVILEINDVAVTIRPKMGLLGIAFRQGLRGEDFGNRLYDQNLLIIGTVENANAAPHGEALGRPPEKVVGEFLTAWLFEAVDLATLRIDPAHDVANGPVLARGIHSLENKEEGVGSVSVENPLEVSQLLGKALH